MSHRSVTRRAFTIVELLVVIGIIALLISILLPTLSKARIASKTTTCASQLHQIYVLGQTWSAENRQAVSGAGWLGAVYKQKGAQVTRCPEADLNSNATVTDQWDLTQMAAGYSVHMVDPNWDVPCVPGPWARAENVTPTSFELSFEDQGKSGGGDMSFNNVRLKFIDNGDGTMGIQVMPSFGGYTSNLIDNTTGATVMTNVGQSAGAVNVGKVIQGTANSGFTNYGMQKNTAEVFGLTDKVYGMDYTKSVIDTDVDNWSDNAPDKFPVDYNGTPVFARHSNKANILFADGSVRLTRVSATELNPMGYGADGSSNKDKYWNAPK